MKVYTYSEARQRFAEILNIAREEDVIIQRRGGETFTIAFKKTSRSPFAIPGIKTKATTADILRAIKDSREMIAEPVDLPGAQAQKPASRKHRIDPAGFRCDRALKAHGLKGRGSTS